MKLKTAWKKDQQERLTYQPYLDTYKDYRVAYNHYVRDYGPFTDFTSYLEGYLRTLKPGGLTDGDWVALWGLAQHATRVPVQFKVLKLIVTFKGKNWIVNKNNYYEYLYDRIMINLNKIQKFGTQNT